MEIHLPGILHIRAAEYRKRRRFSYPLLFFARFPCYPALVILELVESRDLLERQAVPTEFNPGVGEPLVPAHGHGFHAVIDGLLIDEYNRELLWVHRTGPYFVVYEAC